MKKQNIYREFKRISSLFPKKVVLLYCAIFPSKLYDKWRSWDDLQQNYKNFVWSNLNKESMFIFLKTDVFPLQLLCKSVHFYCRKTNGIIRNKHFLNLEKLQYLPHDWTDKGFKGSFVNLKITHIIFHISYFIDLAAHKRPLLNISGEGIHEDWAIWDLTLAEVNLV